MRIVAAKRLEGNIRRSFPGFLTLAAGSLFELALSSRYFGVEREALQCRKARLFLVITFDANICG